MEQKLTGYGQALWDICMKIEKNKTITVIDGEEWEVANDMCFTVSPSDHHNQYLVLKKIKKSEPSAEEDEKIAPKSANDMDAKSHLAHLQLLTELEIDRHNSLDKRVYELDESVVEMRTQINGVNSRLDSVVRSMGRIETLLDLVETKWSELQVK